MLFGLFGKEEPKAIFVIEPRTREAQTFARYLFRENKPLRKAFERAFGAKAKLNDDASRLEFSAAPGHHEQIQVGYRHLRSKFEQGKHNLTDLDIRWTARLLKYVAVDIVFDDKKEERTLEEKFARAIESDERQSQGLAQALREVLKEKNRPGPTTTTP